MKSWIKAAVASGVLALSGNVVGESDGSDIVYTRPLVDCISLGPVGKEYFNGYTLSEHFYGCQSLYLWGTELMRSECFKVILEDLPDGYGEAATDLARGCLERAGQPLGGKGPAMPN